MKKFGKSSNGSAKLTRRDLLRTGGAAGAGLVAGLVPARVMSQAAKPQSISLIGNNGAWFGHLQRGTIPAWEQQTGIKVETLFLPTDALKTKLRAELSAGQAPYDVIIWTGEWRGWIEAYLEDHRKMLPKFEWDDVPEPARTFASGKGKQLGVPYRFTVMMLHYQKKLLEEAGFGKPPETFAELQKAAEACTKGNRYGLGIFGKQGAAIVNGWLPFLYSAGGRLYDEASYEIFVNKPQGVRAMKYIGDLVNKSKAVPPESLTWEWDEIIAGGQNDRYAMSIMHAPYAVALSNPTASKTAGNWAWAPMPGADSKEQGSSWVLGFILSLSTSSKNKDWASDFINFACSSEQMKLSMGTGNLPPRTSVLTNPEIIAKYPWIPQASEVLRRSAQVPGDVMWDTLEQRLRPAISQVLLAQADAQAALDGVSADWTQALKRARVIK